MTDGKVFSSSTLGGDMPFWRVYTDLFPRVRVDFERQSKTTYANVSFRGCFVPRSCTSTEAGEHAHTRCLF